MGKRFIGRKEEGHMEEAKSEKSEALRAYLPAIVAGLLTLTTVILYSTVIEWRWWSVYLAMAIMTLVPFAIIFVNRKWALGLPQYLIILFCVHTVLSVDMGTALGFYGKWKWWDTAVHCFFGFLACATLYYLYFRLKDDRPKAVDYIVMVLLVISFAAIWEVYEFVAGAILDSDMQDVRALMEQGLNPITDTMVDIVVAFVGSLLFLLFLYLKYLFVKRKNRQNR